MSHRTATLYIRITTEDGKRPYCRPVYLSKGTPETPACGGESQARAVGYSPAWGRQGLRKEHLAPDPAANVVVLRVCLTLRRGRCPRERTSVYRLPSRSEGDKPPPGGSA